MKRGLLTVLGLGAACALSILAVRTCLPAGWPEAMDGAVGASEQDAAWFTVIATVAIATGTPRLIFAGLAGGAFGWEIGSVLAQAATMVGGMATFAIARAIGREPLLGWLGDRERKLRPLLEASARHGIAANLLIRSAPVGNFFVTNVLMALCPITARNMLVGTFVGTLPSTVALALLGAGLVGEHAVRGALLGLFALVLAALGGRWLVHRARAAVVERAR